MNPFAILGGFAGKKAATEGAKKVAQEAATETAKKGLYQNYVKPLAKDAMYGGGISAGLTAADGGDASDVMAAAAIGTGINTIGRGVGNKLNTAAANRGGYRKIVNDVFSNPKQYLKQVGPAIASIGTKSANPYVIGGTLLAADAADAAFGDRPSAFKGLWDIGAGGLAYGAGQLFGSDDWKNEGLEYIQRGTEALGEKSNGWFGTNFETPLKDKEESEKIFEASKKGLLDEKGNLPENLQSRRVKAADIQKMNPRNGQGEQNKKQATNHHDKMPVPQVNTLTPEQVAQVTNGSDDVGKWRPGPDGSGVIKRSDGTYTHVRPYTQEEQAARDRQYNDHINDQVNQYMLDYLSKANSSLYSPRERAIYADLALGLRSVMGGGAGGSGAGSWAAAKAAAAQQNQWDAKVQDSVKRQAAHANLAARDKDNKENALLEANLLTENLHDNEMFDEIVPGDIKSLYKNEAGKRAAIDANAAIKKQFGLQKGLRDVYMGNTGPQNFANAAWPFGMIFEPRPVINDGSWLGDSEVDLEYLGTPAREYIQKQAIGNTPYYYEGLRKLRDKE